MVLLFYYILHFTYVFKELTFVDGVYTLLVTIYTEVLFGVH